MVFSCNEVVSSKMHICDRGTVQAECSDVLCSQCDSVSYTGAAGWMLWLVTAEECEVKN